MKIIDRLILRQISLHYLAAHIILVGFFFIVKVADLIDKVIEGNIPLLSLFKLILFLIPSLNSFVFPIASLMAVILTFSSMSAFNEIVVLKSAGVRPLRLSIVPFVFSVFVSIVSLFNNITVIPVSTNMFLSEFRDVAKNKILGSLQENSFNEIMPGIIFLSQKIDKDSKTLKNILIYDATKSSSQIIVAKRGRYGENPDAVFFKLSDGEIHIRGKKGSYQILKFGSYTFSLSLKLLEKGINVRLKDKESSIALLKKRIKDAEERGDLKKARYLKMEIFKRYSLPFACVIFAIIAIPFGMTNVKNPKSWSIFVLVIVVFSYYLLIIVFSNLVKKGSIAPFWGAWMPNFIFLILGLVLMGMVEKEKCLFW